MRSGLLKAAVIGLFAVLFMGLAHIQIIRSKSYRELSEKNIIRVVPVEAPRGRIFDRKGRAVVSNKLSFDVSVVYRELTGFDETRLVKILSDVLNVKKAGVRERLKKAKRTPYIPVVIFDGIDKEKAIVLEEQSFDLKGVIIETRAERDYLFGSAASHILGHLGEVSEGELERLKPYGYRIKDSVGRDGLEGFYNGYLMGKSGGFLVEVDNRGRQVRMIGLKEPSSGKDMRLTIDMNIQLAAERLMADRKGAVVAMDPSSGEVLALVSRPSFDPGVFIKTERSRDRMRLLKNREFPLLNRAVSGLYSPGSVFKVVVAAAALETKRSYEWKEYGCDGAYRLGGRRFRCWKEEGHGKQHMTEGIKNSCNVYFYRLGKDLGVDRIEAFSNRFGLGRPTGIDLPGEASGLVPGRLWKRIHKRKSWYEGETINFSIGQGYLLVTPIQALRVMCVIANGGNLIRPFLVSGIGQTDIMSVKSAPVGLTERTLRTIKESLIKVVNDKEGTGRLAAAEGLTIAGKTGTAQNPGRKSHSWFGGFAPAEDPKVALIVFIEHGGKGGVEAARLAKQLFEQIQNEGYL
ncbi:penicillin-binding protein 2 [Candidatus Omnitrophota bacterium]